MIKRFTAALAALTLALAGLAGSPAVAAPVARQAGPSAAELDAYVRSTEASGLADRLRADQQRAADATKARTGSATPIKGRLPDPRKKSGSAKALTACTGTCYSYNGFAQEFSADPATDIVISSTIGKPFVDAVPSFPGEHSLGEVAASSSDMRDVVEVGWIVDKSQRADGNPFLFAFHWVNGVPKGYGVGFVDYTANPVNLNAGLPKPALKMFGINQSATAWWVYYDGQPVAYLLKSRFTPGGVVRPFNATVADIYVIQNFYEIAGHETDPCTDMGTGTMYDATGTPTPPVGVWSGYSVGGTTVAANLTTYLGNPGTPGVWGVAQDSATSGRAGGPGYSASGGTPGTTGAC